MRVALVTMPWHALDCPSIALGILSAIAERCPTCTDVKSFYGNIHWAEFLLHHSEGRITPNTYTSVANEGIFYGVGDWIFGASLNQTPHFEGGEFLRNLPDEHFRAEHVEEMRYLAGQFIAHLCTRILQFRPDVVGLSTTFMQNVATLSLARMIKKAADSSIAIVLGGGNCEGEQGRTIHRNFEFVDFVVRGEGEKVFAELLDYLGGGGGRLDAISGLCWWNKGLSVPNSLVEAPLSMDQVPTPDYAEYFNLIESSELAEFIEPKIVVEAARGCWWGEKHHCTFCGLNGETMQFRSKQGSVVWKEIEENARMFKCLDIVMVDNIMDMNYFKALLPNLRGSDYDFRIHYEVKSNLKMAHLQALKDAGAVHLQPGIESFSSPVLKIMRKGVSGCQNVRFLRDAETQNVTVSWNYLYGFPGERDPDYLDVISQLSALVHLQPPVACSRVVLERFSPYFNNPSLGFVRRRPAEFYKHCYNLPQIELDSLAYMFETDNCGIYGEVESSLLNAIEDWRRRYSSSHLFYFCDGQTLSIMDRRVGWEPRDHHFEGELPSAMYMAMMQPQTTQSLKTQLSRSKGRATEKEVAQCLDTFKKNGLVFEEGAQFLALATPRNSGRVRIETHVSASSR